VKSLAGALLLIFTLSPALAGDIVRPVWHGVATKTIHESDRENRDETIVAGFPAS
jgi:hypothetical protein